MSGEPDPLYAGAVAVPALVIALSVILRILLVWGLRVAYAVTLGFLLKALANAVDDIWVIGPKLEDAIEAVDRAIEDAIGKTALAVDLTLAKFFDGLAFVTDQLAYSLWYPVQLTYEAFEALIGAVIPGQVKARTEPLSQGLAAAGKIEEARARTEALARSRGIDRLNRDLTREKLARERGIDYLVGRLNTVVIPRIRSLEARLADVVGYTRRTLARRLSRVEQLVIGGALAAIALRVLTRAFPYWRCTNVRRFNRALCRMPLGFLNDLLGLATLAFLLSDVCKLATTIREGAELLQPALLKVVAVADAALECTSFPPPADLALNAVALPSPASPLAL